MKQKVHYSRCYGILILILKFSSLFSGISGVKFPGFLPRIFLLLQLLLFSHAVSMIALMCMLSAFISILILFLDTPYKRQEADNLKRKQRTSSLPRNDVSALTEVSSSDNSVSGDTQKNKETQSVGKPEIKSEQENFSSSVNSV